MENIKDITGATKIAMFLQNIKILYNKNAKLANEYFQLYLPEMFVGLIRPMSISNTLDFSEIPQELKDVIPSQYKKHYYISDIHKVYGDKKEKKCKKLNAHLFGEFNKLPKGTRVMLIYIPDRVRVLCSIFGTDNLDGFFTENRFQLTEVILEKLLKYCTAIINGNIKWDT